MSTNINIDFRYSRSNSPVQEPQCDEYILSAIEALRRSPLMITYIPSEVTDLNHSPLLDACAKADVNMVKMLENRGIPLDEDILDDDKILDVLHAPPEKCLAFLQFLDEKELDLNERHLDSLLKGMIRKGDAYAPVICFFIEKYVDDIDFKDQNGETALMRLCKAEKPQKALIQLFIEKGANIYAENKSGDSLLQTMCEKGKTEIVALLLNRSINYAEKFIQDFELKLHIGRYNGMNSIKGINFEGDKNNAGAVLFSEILKKFPKNITEIIPDEHLKKLIDAFSSASTLKIADEKTVDTIKKGDLVILPLGYKSHTLYLVFCNGYMAICNRGGGCPDGAKMLEAYRIDSKAFSFDMLKKLLEHKQGERAAASEYYYKTLPQALSASKDAVCTQLEGKLLAPKKSQKIGNCTYVNAKLALRAALGMLRITKEGESPKLPLFGIIASKRFSKAVSTHIRLCTLDEYFEFHENNKDLKLYDPKFAKEALALADKHVRSNSAIKLSDYPHVLSNWGVVQ